MSADEVRQRLARVGAILQKSGLSERDRAALIEMRAKLQMTLALMAMDDQEERAAAPGGAPPRVTIH